MSDLTLVLLAFLAAQAVILVFFLVLGVRYVRGERRRRQRMVAANARTLAALDGELSAHLERLRDPVAVEWTDPAVRARYQGLMGDQSWN